MHCAHLSMLARKAPAQPASCVRRLQPTRRKGAIVTTDDDVRQLATALPAVTEKPAYGTPAFYVSQKIFARIHDQPGVLVSWRASMEAREELLHSDPGKFFTTDHYAGHPSVLVRLDRVDREELNELLVEAWAARAPRRLLTAHEPELFPGRPGRTSGASDFPRTMGTVAPRELEAHGITHIGQLPSWTERELLAIHGVGPKAIHILREELDARGLGFRES